jgi:hypothetical protein
VSSAIPGVASDKAEMLAGGNDDEAVIFPGDELPGAQMVAPPSDQPEERRLEKFIEGQLVPIPVEDGNRLEMTVH